MTTPASQASLDRADEPMNNDDAPFDTSSSGGYGVNQRGDAFSRENQTGGAGLKSHFSSQSQVNDDEDTTQSGATTPGGQFRGGSLESFSGLPRRDYAGDQRQTQESADATAQYKAEWARDGVPGGDGLAVNEPQSARRYSETDPNQIGA